MTAAKRILSQYGRCIAFAISCSSLAAGAATPNDYSIMWFGVPLNVILLAFAGSTCALSFLGPLAPARVVVIVLSSTGIGAFSQPLIGWMFGVPPTIWSALAFAVGLGSHVAGTALFGAAPGAIKDALDALISRIRGKA